MLAEQTPPESKKTYRKYSIRSQVFTRHSYFPPVRSRPILFDCDGTIVDSMPLHYVAWKGAVGEWNCPFDEELFYAWGGKPIRRSSPLLNEMHGLKMPVEQVAIRKEDLYLELLGDLKAVPEVLEQIDAPVWEDSVCGGFGQ